MQNVSCELCAMPCVQYHNLHGVRNIGGTSPASARLPTAAPSLRPAASAPPVSGDALNTITALKGQQFGNNFSEKLSF
jgi:hypothetical protein